MRRLLVIILLWINNFACLAQTKPKSQEFYNSMFKWHITIPENFTNMSPDEYSKNQQKGANAIEKTLDAKIENHSIPIFVVKSDQLHYMESNYQLYNIATDGDYSLSCKNVDDILYQTFVKQMPKATIDTIFSTEKINNIQFITFHLIIHLPNKQNLTMFMYNHLFGNKDFTMALMFVDANKGTLMMNAWKKSVFGN